jgi:FixJ family two-component response regulator
MGGDDSSAQSAGRVIRRGGQDFLQKPIPGAVLVKTIQTILENIIERVSAATHNIHVMTHAIATRISTKRGLVSGCIMYSKGWVMVMNGNGLMIEYATFFRVK